MHQIVEWFSSNAVQMIDALGLAGIFVGMVLESACIPISSEVILLSGGAAAASGTMTFSEVVDR
ncbi:hypothetical protein [Paenibacillus sp. sgz302251]|uniref:hypothetical protein n=1 Tax=Paenibacillus sp. sgz302251 TaxID=3414493 RepID=UPI003C7E2708